MYIMAIHACNICVEYTLALYTFYTCIISIQVICIICINTTDVSHM